MTIVGNQQLKEFTTFGVEATARLFATVYSVAELRELIAEKSLAHEPKLVLGGGSNVLFTRDFDGLVIRNAIRGIQAFPGEGAEVIVKAGGGVDWDELVTWCIERNYAGLENLSKIPGSVGAAPVQNIGAYGVELKDVFRELEAIDLHTGEAIHLNESACVFGYRESIFKHEYRGLFLIHSVSLGLQDLNVRPDYKFKIDQGGVRQKLDEHGVTVPSLASVRKAVCEIRAAKLPDPVKFGNAGSFFKNPVIPQAQYETLAVRFPDMPHYPYPGARVKIPAGWLIEQCGWKGKMVGHTGVYKTHALVLVNYGGATGREVLALAYSIQKSVSEHFGIELLPEVNIF
ncbi:MAG: UDP-N-acetylenolpyruvoylglucosamine reductase [Candidatus Omnitrophica bacterium ADurb.Bin277]|nr:MAG: UDP-N-acetylenolpyruvoylglucosamine reductase [Candidatus Omnitrophica bacterium ADurb.Bin277]